MTEGAVIPWREVREPQAVNGDMVGLLATVEALRRAWEDAVATATAEEFAQARLRNLRRHAIETGIIERLYDVEWGVTQALVADGLSAEVAAREGGIGEAALEVIRSQFDALTFLAETSRDDRPLTSQLIRELHVALCRTQLTYEAHDSLGRLVHPELHHGRWKQHPNHVRRPDGTLLQYVPPEHVQSEIDRMLDLYETSAASLPVLVRAAWLHHAFACIHPFEDGNGRVARALTMLVLLRADYSPLVIDRFSRSEYFVALDQANVDDLGPLGRPFVRREVIAMRSELGPPPRLLPPTVGTIKILRDQQERAARSQTQISPKVALGACLLAEDLHERVGNHLSSAATRLQSQFFSWEPLTTWAVYDGGPGKEKAFWHRSSIIRAARDAGFEANLVDGAWWRCLRFFLPGASMWLIAVTQKVGEGETGVVALTFFANSMNHAVDGPTGEVRLLSGPDVESATVTYTENLDDRWEGIADMLDRALAVAISGFAAGLA